MKTVVFLDSYLPTACRGYPLRIGREEIGSQLVAACCQKMTNWKIRYLRPNSNDPKIIEGAINTGTCDALVLFPYTYTKWLADGIARLFKGKVPIIYGGYHAGITKITAQGVFSEGLTDYVVWGRGDKTLPKLLNDLDRGKMSRGVLSGKNTVSSKKYPLDDLPWPFRDQKLMQDLAVDPISFKPPENLEPNPIRLVIIAGSIGCKGRCDFCVSHKICSVPLHRSPKNIVDEMIWLKQVYGPGLVFFFTNPLFNADREWVMTLCAEMEKRGPFPSIIMPDFCIDKEMVESWKKAGVFLALMGLEFINDRMRVKRGKRAGDPANAYNLCAEKGIITRAFYMLGRLGMTRADLKEETKNLLSLSYHPDELRINFEVPFPGTKKAEQISANDIILEQRHWTTEQPVYRTGLTAEEWQKARQQIVHDFHFNQRQQEHYERQISRFPELENLYKGFLKKVDKMYE